MFVVDFRGTYIYVYIPGTCECPLFLGLKPPKEGPLQSKRGLFGLLVYMINELIFPDFCFLLTTLLIWGKES